MKDKVPLRKIPIILFLLFTLIYAVYLLLENNNISVLTIFLITILFAIIEIGLICLAFKDKYDSDYRFVNQEKFLNNEKYRKRKTKNLYKQEDKAYKRKIYIQKKAIKRLTKKRTKEMMKQEKMRWIDVESLKINQEEGKIAINKEICWFSDIKGASLNCIYGNRSISQTTGKSISKKKASLGGAILGGMVNPIGAVIGGSVLGKTKTNIEQSTSTNYKTTCEHLGVNVNINSFISEIVILNRSVDQDSAEYTNSMEKAHKIISVLQQVSKTPVPQNVERLEDKASVADITKRMEEATRKLEFVIQNRPKHELPDELKFLLEQTKK